MSPVPILSAVVGSFAVVELVIWRSGFFRLRREAKAFRPGPVREAPSKVVGASGRRPGGPAGDPVEPLSPDELELFRVQLRVWAASNENPKVAAFVDGTSFASAEQLSAAVEQGNADGLALVEVLKQSKGLATLRQLLESFSADRPGSGTGFVHP